MKKNFFKKLALVMAMTLAVGSVPAANADAAATPGFKSAAVNVKVGQTKKYNTVNASKYSVKFVIGNKSVATINYSKGSKAVKVTGVAEGTTRMRAEFKSYKTKKVTTVKIPVTVKPNETAIVSAVQNTTTKVTATFEGDTSAVKAENLAITKDDNSVIAIKSAAVDTTDKSKVVIETYAEMKDGATYTITFNEKSKASFKATDGTVANVDLDTLVVTAAKAEEVKVQTLDAAGVILGAYTLENAGSNNLEYSIETTDGYVDGSKLYLTEVGKTAKAKVVYHTWKYDEAGNETGKIEREFTITAVKDATVISNFVYTIADKAPAWDSASFKVNTSIAANDASMQVFFNIKDSKDNQVDYTAYSVASSDTSKLIVDETKLADNATGVSVVGVNAGTAYILLKNEDGNTVKTFPVTVLADRKASALTVDASAFVLSNGANAYDSKTVTLTVKDQYGVEMDFVDGNVDVETLSAPKGVDKNTVTCPTSTNGKLTFTGTDYATKGTYTFKVSVTVDDVTVSRTITVNVKEPSATVKSYELVVGGVDAKNSIDLAVASDATTGSAIKKVTLKVVGKDAAGVLVEEFGGSVNYTVKHSTGTELTPVSGNIGLTVASGSAISVAENVKTGTYTVTAKFTPAGDTKEKTIVKTFNVADTQVAPSINVKSTDADGDTILAALANSDLVVYSYDGKNSKDGGLAITVVKADTKTTSSAGNVFVKSVTVIFPVNDNVDREITINVNKTFTNVAN